MDTGQHRDLPWGTLVRQLSYRGCEETADGDSLGMVFRAKSAASWVGQEAKPFAKHFVRKVGGEDMTVVQDLEVRGEFHKAHLRSTSRMALIDHHDEYFVFRVIDQVIAAPVNMAGKPCHLFMLDEIRLPTANHAKKVRLLITILDREPRDDENRRRANKAR